MKVIQRGDLRFLGVEGLMVLFAVLADGARDSADLATRLPRSSRLVRRPRLLVLPLLLLLFLVAVAPGSRASAQTAGPAEPPPPTNAENSVEIEYIAHASFLLRSPGGVELLLDPYQSRVWLGYDFPEGLEPDAVLITHPHYDHDAGRFRGAEFPWPEASLLDGPGRLELGDVTVVGLEGKHADPYGKEFGQRNTLMVIEIAGVRIAHLGDNGPLTRTNIDELGRIDVLMLPADGLDHILSREQTAAILEAVRPRVIIPMHYRLPDLETSLDSPSGLGEIDPWLAGRPNVRRLGGHRMVLNPDNLPPETTILVFEHAPYVRPGGP